MPWGAFRQRYETWVSCQPCRKGSRLSWVRRYRWLVGAVLALAVGVLVAVIVWWPEREPEPRARVYRDYDVCVLMSGRGLADPQAAAVWSGAQQVSQVRDVRVLYVSVAGEQSPQRAGEFLASLVQQECEVIVAVGEGPVAAAAANKAKFPAATIVAVGDEIEDTSNEDITSSTVEVLLRLVPEG